MTSFFQDFRYACRGLIQARGFATVAILCLSFGVGLNATIFSILDGVILQPYPYPEADRIRVIGEQVPKTGDESGLSFLDWRDLKAANSGLAVIGASTTRSFVYADGTGDPDRYSGAAVSWDLFPMLGIAPAIGQPFTAAHDQPGGPGVVLLSDDLWTARYRRDPAVIGRSISLNGKPYQVLGVMPPGFRFPTEQRLWIPLQPLVSNEPRSSRGLFALGRLAPGVSPEQAHQQIDAAFRQLASLYPSTNQDRTSRIRTLRETFVPEDVTRVVWIMMSSVTLVLFVACANVASLLVARASTRRREMSVRAALGAGRARIVRQLLTESVVLGALSVPLGIILAEIGTRLIAAALPPDQVPYYVHWQIDWRSVAYTVTIALSTALIFGLFPALHASRGNLHEALKEGSRGNSASKSLLRSALVVVQVALALVALVGAFLFLRTFHNLDSAQLGFDARPLMTVRFAMSGDPYDVPDAKLRRVEDVVRRIEALPGVRSAFGSNFVPLNGGGDGGDVEIEGRPITPGSQSGISLLAVTPHFVQTMGLALLTGRNLTDAEGWGRQTVAIVDQQMVRRFWPNGNALGARFRLIRTPPADWLTVVGIVPDMTLYGVDPSDPTPPAAAFVPYAYQQALNTGLTIRTAGDPAAITGAVRAELRAADPTMAVFQARSMEELRRLQFWQYGLYGWIFGTIGVTGLLLASVGVYGVLSYSVAQRTKELGVRVALGAGRRELLRLIVGQGVSLCGVGIGVGLLLAPAGTWFGRSLFFDVSPFDPLSFAGVALVLFAVAVVASYLPARRAMRVDALTALRAE